MGHERIEKEARQVVSVLRPVQARGVGQEPASRGRWLRKQSLWVLCLRELWDHQADTCEA